jgi:ABC-type Fe3+-siderophore transport system permease subunit
VARQHPKPPKSHIWWLIVAIVVGFSLLTSLDLFQFLLIGSNASSAAQTTGIVMGAYFVLAGYFLIFDRPRRNRRRHL